MTTSAKTNPARVVDAYVDQLDLRDFDRARPADTGRPGYHPATLLKIYLYGYLNRIQSSRRLEREAQRNVELMWLTGRLAPDFKTIADFRRDNGASIRFAKDDFTFNAADNTYRCPAGEALTYRFTSVEHDLKLDVYWTTKCLECPIRARCTTGDIRRIKRWEKESVVDAMLQRLEAAPDSMNVRRRTVEHPFGTLKSWMGATHFLTKGIDNVATEMSLNVLAYNLKRMMAIMGVRPLIERLAA